MTDTTIYGYTIGGEAFHPGCLANGSGLQVEGKAYGLYDLDDDGEGLWCDACGEAIFEDDEDDDDEWK
jgi:hypothetical protein